MGCSTGRDPNDLRCRRGVSESVWVARAAAGDRGAFDALVRLHQSRLRGFLRRLARGDHALADDVAQDAFLEAWRKIAQFRGEGRFSAWLMQIAYSRFLMSVRTRKLEPLEGEHESASPNPEAATAARLDLEAAMAQLALPERATLTACYALGYSHEETAAMLAMPLGTVKSHILRGREKLRRWLEPGI